METKDLIRFKHMIDSTEAILSFTRDRSRADLDTDRQLLSAILREFEIVGEAAGKITSSTQARFSKIQWKEIISMRNRLIHAYFDVDHDVIWNTIRDYLPAFVKDLEAIVYLLSTELERK